MLRNRSRAVTKQSPIMADHQASPLPPTTSQSPTRSNSYFFGSPRFFSGGFLPESLSPTSILDTKTQLCNFAGNPFGFSKNPKNPTKIVEKIKHPAENFGCEGIALALVLIEENSNSNICKPKTITRKLLSGSKLYIQIPEPFSNGSPESPGDFGIKTRNSQFSADPNPTVFGSPRFFKAPLSLSEMELSEEYTRVISHGSNPKTTHIYDNCVVESCCGFRVGSEASLESFVSFCNTCKKHIGEGSDIFIYRIWNWNWNRRIPGFRIWNWNWSDQILNFWNWNWTWSDLVGTGRNWNRSFLSLNNRKCTRYQVPAGYQIPDFRIWNRNRSDQIPDFKIWNRNRLDQFQFRTRRFLPVPDPDSGARKLFAMKNADAMK